jgi:hypothetical protein
MYNRACLNFTLTDVRQHRPGIAVSDAWVHKNGRDQWEFHFEKFYWHGHAQSALQARSAGWSAWLTKEGAKGYRPEKLETSVIL